MRNPWLAFLPFLVLYSVIVICLHSDKAEGDEARYLFFAENITHGFYSPPDINLWNGPGYPLIIAPLVALKAPPICITLLNALFYYLSLILLFKSVSKFASFRVALLVSCFWALYYNLYQNLPHVMTETFSAFLVSLLVFCIISGRFYTAGITLGYLVLTKIIFGYVLVLLLIGALAVWLVKRTGKGVLVCGVALVVIMPYLIYTYNLTGRPFYLGNSGGLSLYWMSDLSENEYGDWKGDLQTEYSAADYIPGGLDSLKAHHQKDAEALVGLRGVEKDDALKAMAIRNIRSHPGKYIKNCWYNAGRLLFNYPFSYQAQTPKTLARIPMNFIIAVLGLISVLIGLKTWKSNPGWVKFLMGLILVYLAGNVLLSAYTRMFTVIVPALLVLIAYFARRFLI